MIEAEEGRPERSWNERASTSQEKDQSPEEGWRWARRGRWLATMMRRWVGDEGERRSPAEE